jgi:AsmA protein
LDYFSKDRRFRVSKTGLPDQARVFVSAATPLSRFWNVDMKALKIASAALAVLIGGVAALLVIGIPSDFLTSAIQARLEGETGYRIVIAGATRLGIWPSLHVTVHDVSLGNAKDGDVNANKHLTVDRIEADISWQSILSGGPQIGKLAIIRPVLRVPLLRERSRGLGNPSKPPAVSGDTRARTFTVGHLTISDGIVVFSNPEDHVEDHIDGINADARAGVDRRIDITGSARLGEHPLQFNIKATAPTVPGERQTVPVELTLDAPGLLHRPLSGRAEVRLNGSVLMINGLTGTLGDGQFNGWASADLASKPLVKVDVDFQRLNVGTSSHGQSGTEVLPPTDQPWSVEKIDLTGLNYIDSQIRVSAAELTIGDARIAPAAVDATLGSGVLKAAFSNLGVYGGEADGNLTVDVRTNSSAYTLNCDLSGIRALPLLSNLADFDRLDGKMQAKISVRAEGDNQRAVVSSLSGSAFVNFQDGAIRGLNVARMIRSLTSGTLSGWQAAKDETTDLTQLGASFRIERGQATTGDLALSGPLVRMSGAGTVDLVAKSLAFRVEPKLVMSLEGQGGAADPVGLGVPVMVQGPWSAPSIYPEIAGILSDPDAAYGKLREMGKGLFNSGVGASDALGGKLGDTLGTLIQQGLGAAAPRTPAAPQDSQGKPAAPDQSSPMNDILKQLFGR